MNTLELNIKSAVLPSFRWEDVPGLKILSLPARQIRNDYFADDALLNFNRGTPQTGNNLVSNYDFSEGFTGWNKTGDWYMEENCVKIDQPSGNSGLSKTLALNASSLYEVRLVINDYTVGELTVNLGGSNDHSLHASGDFRLYIKSGVLSDLEITAEDAVLSVSSITVKPVTDSLVGTTGGAIQSNSLNGNSGFWFDGINDFISFGDVHNPREYDIFIFCWIKIPATPPFSEKMELFSKGSQIQYMTIDTMGWPGFYLNSGNYRTDKISQNIADGNWHFLTLQHSWANGTILTLDNSINTLRIGNSISSLENSDNFEIGKYPLGRYFQGYLGISGFCVFDGNDNAPSVLPDDIIELSNTIFSATNFLHR